MTCLPDEVRAVSTPRQPGVARSAAGRSVRPLLTALAAVCGPRPMRTAGEYTIAIKSARSSRWKRGCRCMCNLLGSHDSDDGMMTGPSGDEGRGFSDEGRLRPDERVNSQLPNSNSQGPPEGG